MAAIEVVGLDADDTLWHDEAMFIDISSRFHRLLEQYLGPNIGSSDTGAQANPVAALEATERANLELFGYGVKAYTLSLIETAITITDGRISSYDIHQIINWGKEMLALPVQLLDGVATVVPQLAERYRVMVITKGDLWNQEAKVARSGLESHLEAVEVVAEKDPSTYRRVLARHGISPDKFVMVGNSLRSDIAPALELGARAVHIKFPTTWALDQVPAGFLDPDTYTEIDSMHQLLAALQDMED